MQFNIKNNTITFVADENESTENLDFIQFAQDFVFKIHGANVQVYNKQEDLLLSINPFDNTQFIVNAEGSALASKFGAKRFLVGELRKEQVDQVDRKGAIFFPRDLSFPIAAQAKQTSNYQVKDLAALLHEWRTDKAGLYTTLAELFNRCADFTPGKQDEYLTGGKREDKFCRFNNDNQLKSSPVTTSHVFLTDEKNKIAGTISIDVINGKNGTLDLYFYDEVVDYYLLLNEEEKNQLSLLAKEFESTQESDKKERLKHAIADLIEPKRNILLAQLFNAASDYCQSLPGIQEKLDKETVHAFIRAAAGREEAYVKVGCGKENHETLVIHGPPTDLLKKLDVIIKEWAKQQLNNVQPKLSTVSLLAHTQPLQPTLPQIAERQTKSFNM